MCATIDQNLILQSEYVVQGYGICAMLMLNFVMAISTLLPHTYFISLYCFHISFLSIVSIISQTFSEPFYGQLVIGLFGDVAPNHVKEFLSYVDVPFDMDAPLPSYSRSKFQTLDSATGLLIGGTIPGLDVTTLAGGNVLEYSGKVFPAKLWLEDRRKDDTPQLSHNAKGLITHRNLDPTPSFGITTRNTSTSLDSTHTIFACLLEDKAGLIDQVVDLPVLTDTGRVSKTSNEPVIGGNNDIGSSLASSVFTAQRAVFRDAAKTFGDTRLDKMYDGKLLRRIEVTKVGTL